jgi:hypothetical protein
LENLSLSPRSIHKQKRKPLSEKESLLSKEREREKAEFLFRQRQKNAFRALKVCVII